MSRKSTSPKNQLLPHSEAKVKFYKLYLEKLLSATARSKHVGEINIFDVFCGMGVYPDGKLGSPIKALEAIQETEIQSKSEIITNVYLNDLVKSKVKSSQRYIKSHFAHNICNVSYLNKTSDEVFADICALLKLRSYDALNLVFIDPYGYKQIHKSDLENLMACDNTEVLLFLPISFMHRFNNYAFDEQANKGAEPLRRFVSEFFPPEHPMRNVNFTLSVYEYIKAIADAFSFEGKYLTTTYYIRRDGRNIYALFFVTKNIGHLEMAVDTLWKVDPYGQHTFIYDNEKTLELFAQEEFVKASKHEKLENLKMRILKEITNKGELNNNELYEFTVRSGYKIDHIKEVIRDCEDIQVEIQPLQGQYKRHQYPISYSEYQSKKPKLKFTIKQYENN